MKILIVEDEESIAKSLVKNFLDEGFETSLAIDGEEALDVISKNNFDTILLDWRIPKISGIQVCKTLRESGFNKPIILVTALTDISNKVEALNLGADDYITKPFSFDEVLARILAVNRRYNSAIKSVFIDDIEFDLLNRELKTDKNIIKLSDKEFELLKYFMDNKGKILNKEILCKDVWELPFIPETNIVEVTVKNLRKKLESNSDKKIIQTIYGEGYIFLID
ncbi:MAG: response regulator transcription factor [Ignavibacteriae bacterium]|nr:response regulator transcription factor [Ignavibacteriota bacterium]